jgi:hypothetical protein
VRQPAPLVNRPAPLVRQSAPLVNQPAPGTQSALRSSNRPRLVIGKF